MSEVLSDIWAFLPQLWVIGEQPAFLLKGIEQVIRGSGVILGDVEPDIDQILFSLGGLLNNDHIQSLSVVLCRAFARSLLDLFHRAVPAFATLHTFTPQTS